jgi:hypothetical protein
MGLYLCVFANDDDEELDGVEVGRYEDFYRLRQTVTELLEEGVQGSRYPTLQLHADSDGEWSPEDARRLSDELLEINARLSSHPASVLPEGWQRDVARTFGLSPKTLADTFFDVDGEPLLERLLGQADVSIKSGRPIAFQ